MYLCAVYFIKMFTVHIHYPCFTLRYSVCIWFVIISFFILKKTSEQLLLSNINTHTHTRTCMSTFSVNIVRLFIDIEFHRLYRVEHVYSNEIYLYNWNVLHVLYALMVNTVQVFLDIHPLSRMREKREASFKKKRKEMIKQFVSRSFIIENTNSFCNYQSCNNGWQ